MILNHEFAAAAPVERVWALLDRLDAVVACMPGASYQGQEGENILIGMHLKVGVIAFHFKGAAQFIEKDPVQHRAIVKGAAKDVGGKGSSNALISAQLHDLGSEGTRVTLTTELVMSGKAAQFGGSVLNEIAGRLVQQFAKNLQQLLASDPDAASRPKLNAEKPLSVETSAAARDALDLGGILKSIVLQWLQQRWVIAVLSFLAGWLVCRLLQ